MDKINSEQKNLLCVSINDKSFEKCKLIAEKCDFVELRQDLCHLESTELQQIIKAHPNMIFTCRHSKNDNTEREALEFTRIAIESGTKFVDVDINSGIEYINQVKEIKTSSVSNTKLIISSHDFYKTPENDELYSIYNRCIEYGADIAKIITTAQNTADAVRGLRLLSKELPLKKSKYKTIPIVTFAMGKAGKFTRLMCLKLGAPWTYVSYGAGNETAPGQYSYSEMCHLLSENSYPYKFSPKRFTKKDASRVVEISIPCSKSVSQRAILAACLSKGTSVLNNYSECNDSAAALRIIQKLGCETKLSGRTLTITSPGVEDLNDIDSINVSESGTLARVMLVISTFLNKNHSVVIDGEGSLLNRNLEESIKALRVAGVDAESVNNTLPIKVNGHISKKNIVFSGAKSSQIVTGFLMTLPLLNQDTELVITNPTSVPYLNLTCDVLSKFGINIQQEIVYRESEDIAESDVIEKIYYTIKGGQCYKSVDMFLESDWSSAAFFAVAGAISPNSPDVILKDMNMNSAQADMAIVKALRDARAKVKIVSKTDDDANNVALPHKNERVDIRISHGRFSSSYLCIMSVDSPDLFPILSVLLCFNEGGTIGGISRLYAKESNRAEAIFSELTKLGADVDLDDIHDSMEVQGDIKSKSSRIHGSYISAHNDHRMAMSLIVASMFADGDIYLDDISCINKSFPDFLDEIQKF